MLLKGWEFPLQLKLIDYSTDCTMKASTTNRPRNATPLPFRPGYTQNIMQRIKFIPNVLVNPTHCSAPAPAFDRRAETGHGSPRPRW